MCRWERSGLSDGAPHTLPDSHSWAVTQRRSGDSSTDYTLLHPHYAPGWVTRVHHTHAHTHTYKRTHTHAHTHTHTHTHTNTPTNTPTHTWSHAAVIKVTFVCQAPFIIIQMTPMSHVKGRLWRICAVRVGSVRKGAGRVAFPLPKSGRDPD